MDLSSLKLCGRQFQRDEIKAIRELIAQQPTITRDELSRRICDLLDWFRPQGNHI